MVLELAEQFRTTFWALYEQQLSLMIKIAKLQGPDFHYFNCCIDQGRKTVIYFCISWRKTASTEKINFIKIALDTTDFFLNLSRLKNVWSWSERKMLQA